mmetsp:Transcript_25967/g.30604  ORF Transcript_25967/g.30604 Transcript_25967/m.30604 type:complete len:336 (-) Transcript_25967:46-1053(-)
MINSLRKRTLSSLQGQTPDVFTRDEKNILLMVKNGFAFSWGFLNVIIFSISGRYATVMTGNLLILATEVRAWKVEEMLLTLTLIMTYICAGAVYNYISIRLHQNTVVLYLMPLILSLGVLADFLQYMSNSCSSTEQCSGTDLYFLTPVSILTGLVAAGYCFNHKDGVTTNAMTDHLSVFPTTVITILFTECADSDHLMEKSRQSVSVILSFFVGVIAGDSARKGISTQYTQQRFTPLFTSFGIGITILCFIHHNYCTTFFDHHRVIGKTLAKENGRRYSVVCTGTNGAEMPEKTEADEAGIFSTMTSSVHEIAEDSESWDEKEEQKGDVVGVAEI